MSRLIDADKLIEEINNLGWRLYDTLTLKGLSIALETINQQPTAFDVDKVVKHIEECNRMIEKDMEKKIDRELRIYYEGQLFIANEIIKLIKRGGIND